MEEIFKQYGAAIITAGVIILLLGLIIAAFKLPAFNAFLTDLIDSFMDKAGLITTP